VSLRDTIVAPATGAGAASRAVVRLSGPGAFPIASATFAPEEPGPLVPGFRPGSFVLDAAGIGCPGELWCFAKPRSYTGEDVVEIHVPGAPKVVDLVLRKLLAGGARLAERGEFTRRALLNGRLDLTRAEAIAALVRARDEHEHRRARSLLDGGLAREIASFEDRVVALLVPIELDLDFSDQDVTILDSGREAHDIRALASDLAAFGGAARPEARRLLPRVVIRGPANAGKSSLFNALLAREEALATPHAGTTRDVLCAEWRHGEARALLVDTAGDDVRKTALDERAHEARERALLEADVVLEVRDVRKRGWPPPAQDAVRVATMTDLAGPEAACAENVTFVSNVTGAGLASLRDRIAEALACAAARSAGPFLVTVRQSGHVMRAREALERAAAVVSGGPSELAASDLRVALRELRAIRGAEGGDPVLDRIFSEFCIGK
jgi:tRNA modification GTPase